jgi:hypothetical protein
MRNIMVYPITTEEKIEAISWALAQYVAKMDALGIDRPIGDVTGAALQAVIDDLKR